MLSRNTRVVYLGVSRCSSSVFATIVDANTTHPSSRFGKPGPTPSTSCSGGDPMVLHHLLPKWISEKGGHHLFACVRQNTESTTALGGIRKLCRWSGSNTFTT